MTFIIFGQFCFYLLRCFDKVFIIKKIKCVFTRGIIMNIYGEYN